MNYYNEFNPKAAAWLRELIRQKQIPEGVVDERSITEVQPDDLVGYTQCHFFAGIAGWSLALRLAGWPEDKPVWTGSCPCQPFSCAGKGLGINDERHLWPEFARLITKRSPATIFGEQVASKDGREWLTGIRVDLEALGYAVGAADLCAASVGAPHIRQRLFWMAHATSGGRGEQRGTERPGSVGHINGGGAADGLADAESNGREVRADLHGKLHREGFSERRSIGSWDAYELIPCRDGKTRRVEPGTFPLVDGFPSRVDLLRGYGNAIVPQVAAEFISAYMEIQR